MFRKTDVKNVKAAIAQTPQDTDTSAVTISEENYLDRQVEREVRLEELRTLQEFNKALAQNNAERKIYAKLIFVITCVWTAAIFVIIFLVGFRKMTISDTIVVTLISSTTVNFFGFFYLVVKYLFNTEQPVMQKKILQDNGQ